MDLFNKEDFIPEEAKREIERKKYNKARRKFSKQENKMVATINEKTKDPENINYGKVHIEIYNEVGLGKEWRVGKSKNSNEIEKASSGFKTVTTGMEPYDPKSQDSKSIIGLIISFFRREK
ncbi:MAG: hypothetical protein AAF518_20560 [Spirochaetota bacterium]